MSEHETTYKEICAIEPRLTGLDALAKKAGQIDGLLDAKHNTTANYALRWYSWVKERFLPLVGWGRRPPGMSVEIRMAMKRLKTDVYSLGDPVLDAYEKEKQRCIGCEPAHRLPLYASPAYDVVYDHLNQIYDRAYNRHCHQFHDQMKQ